MSMKILMMIYSEMQSNSYIIDTANDLFVQLKLIYLLYQ